MILVFPDGSDFGWYVDSPIEKESQYGTYIAKELVAFIDATFPTRADRTARAIMGLSMGGHGALLLTALNPDVFSSASSLSGILKISNHPGKWHIAGRLGDMKTHEQNWIDNSVWDQAERFQKANVKIMFDCGEKDTGTGAIGDSRQLHERLKELGVPHIWREFPGTHSWTYWQEHLPQHLNFHQANLVEQTPGFSKWQSHYFNRLAKFYEENSKLAVTRPTKPTLLLLGSSTSEGMPPTLFPDFHLINRGISSDVLGVGERGISHRMEASVFDTPPDYLVFLNGTNDLGDRTRNGEPSIERMIDEVNKIFTEIQTRLPDTKVFVVSCTPVNGRYRHLATPTVSCNKELQITAKKYGFKYLDLHKKFVGDDGLLNMEYSGDGLHMNFPGKKLWADMILDAVEKSKVVAD
jgi:lysophospholipase L1-like esterase/esterase/lipase superfamily enzyme